MCNIFVVFAPFKTQCQQELDQVLERISKMPFRDNRGPLEDLYALHIPNCDKRGQYNLKQVIPSTRMSNYELRCVSKSRLEVPFDSALLQNYDLFCFSVRCLCTVSAVSAGASTLTLADPFR